MRNGTRADGDGRYCHNRDPGLRNIASSYRKLPPSAAEGLAGQGLLLLGCLLAMGIAAQYYVNHKLAAPRTLSDSQMRWIAEQLSPFKGHRVIVGAVPLSTESLDLANTIVETLKLKPAEMNANINQAGVAAEMGIARPCMKSTPEGIVRGVLVKYTTGNEKGRKLCSGIRCGTNGREHHGLRCGRLK